MSTTLLTPHDRAELLRIEERVLRERDEAQTTPTSACPREWHAEFGEAE